MRKKVFCIVFTTICICLFGGLSAQAVTRDEAINWVAAQNDTKIGDGQCVALIASYYSYLGRAPVAGNAGDYATNTLPSGWTRDQGGVPQKGDILVYTGGYGHVAIFESTNVSWHQNWGGQTVQRVSRAYNQGYSYNGDWISYWGCIRPQFDDYHDPNGCLDECAGGAGTVYVRGWAYDSDVPSESIEVHVYIGGSVGSSNTIGYAIKADETRDDVNAAFGITGKHGFADTITTTKRGKQDVYIYAINAGGGTNNPLIATTSVTITDPTYTVSYNANGGSGAPSSQTKTHGVNLTLSSTKPTRTGYTFKNWNTAANGSGTSYSAGGTYSANAAVTLYAQWTANTYTVSYNANGGSGAPSSQTKTHGVNLTLSSTKPTRTGYTFKNWNTAANGSGTSYSAGGTYSANAAVTLYAQWTANTYTVTFNANGGATDTASKTVTYNSTYGTLPTPTLTGYSFTGWYTAASGGTKVTADTKVTITANQTLYAQWSINSYTLHVRPMGGVWEGSTEEKSFKMKYGESKNISDPTRKGYQFVAWTFGGYGTIEPWGKSTLPSGVSPQFYNKETLEIYNGEKNGSVTIETVAKEASCPTTSAYMQKITTLGTSKPGLGGFVQSINSKPSGVFYHMVIAKVPEGYELEYNYNLCGDGTKFEWLTSSKGTGQWETYIYKVTCGTTGTFWNFGYLYVVPTGTEQPWKTEFTTTSPFSWYVGFSDVYDATGVNKNGNAFTMGSSDNVGLQAAWRANDYTVRYDSNGGSGKMDDSAHRYDAEKALSKNAFTKRYCRFKGWNTEADGSGTAYADGVSVKNLTDENNGVVTLYAQWERTQYTESVLKEYSGYSQLSVNICGITAPAKVIVASYKDGRLVKAEMRNYASGNEIFALFGDFDTVKVMVWDGMKPLTVTEVLENKTEN